MKQSELAAASLRLSSDALFYIEQIETIYFVLHPIFEYIYFIYYACRASSPHITFKSVEHDLQKWLCSWAEAGKGQHGSGTSYETRKQRKLSHNQNDRVRLARLMSPAGQIGRIYIIVSKVIDYHQFNKK